MTRVDNSENMNRRLETAINNLETRIEAKIENTLAQQRIIKGDMKTLTKVVDKKNAESAKMNEIVSNFKDRLMEKW